MASRSLWKQARVSTCSSKRLLHSLRFMEHFGVSGPVTETAKTETKGQPLFFFLRSETRVVRQNCSDQSLLMLLRPEEQETKGFGLLAYPYTTGFPSGQRECLCLQRLALGTRLLFSELSEENPLFSGQRSWASGLELLQPQPLSCACDATSSMAPGWLSFRLFLGAHWKSMVLAELKEEPR